MQEMTPTQGASLFREIPAARDESRMIGNP